jgi:F-box and WD-40 domain protein CDC4
MVDRFKALDPKSRFAFLSALIGEITLPEALVISRRIEPKLRRDFLRELPTELALHCLSFVRTFPALPGAPVCVHY